MKLDEIVAWYQKRIGTYDKQQWEKTVEQRKPTGITDAANASTRLKSEFIDVDLVRGSSFPKAKPKQSLFTVIRFAILRYILLPLYSKWWVQHTTPKTFALLLFLYLTQMFNLGVYMFNVHNIGSDSERIVSPSELFIPMALSFILSFIHSQIVATNSGGGVSSKRKQVFNLKGKKRDTVLRWKKTGSAESKVRLSKQAKLNAEINAKQNTRQSDLNVSDVLYDHVEDFKQHVEHCGSSSLDEQTKPSVTLSVPNATFDEENATICEDDAHIDDTCVSHKKRSVNWDSPIRNYVCDNDCPLNVELLQEHTSNTVRIDDSVQEFYDNLVQCTEDELANDNDDVQDGEDANPPVAQNVAEQTGEDDGFESFSGKSSSGEENLQRDQSQLAQNRRDLRLNLDNATAQQAPNQVRKRSSYKNSREQSMEELDDGNIPAKRKTASTSDHAFRKKIPSKLKSQKYSHNSFESMHDKLSQIYQKERRLEESSETDEEGDDGETISNPASASNPNYNECTTSATEWFGITTNSEECSYSSEIDNSDDVSEEHLDYDYTPTVILNPCGSNDRISCTVWDNREMKKEMSVLDISTCIIDRVEAMPESNDYIIIGAAFTILLSLIPSFCRICEATVDAENADEINYFEVSMLLWEKASYSFFTTFDLAFGTTKWERMIRIISFIQRIFLTFLLFFLLSVAERTFKQRFLYAKLFSHLTSSRRARKSEVPHFRLNKVRNIKTWLSVRSYLQRRGPQRSVDTIVSAAFMLTLLLLAFLSVELLKYSDHLHSQYNLEALFWSIALGIFLLRFMTLGNKINQKYRSISVLITEQINLYLQIGQKPKNKEELMVSNSVLKLASDLLKELESPFKISGLNANPYLYTTIKFVILSAFSGVLSEMFGFKLKLHKIKIK